VGKLIGSLFFAGFLAAGCFFAAAIGREMWRVVDTYRWTRADCEIVSSSARARRDGDSSKPYEFLVEYRYDSGHGWLTSARWSSKAAQFAQFDEAQRLAERYRPGTRTHCWRNPADVHDVVLERQSLLFALVLLFPLIFVAIGAWGIWAVWRKWKPGERAEEKPISERTRTTTLGSGCTRSFFLIFVLIGAGVLWALTIRPLIEIVLARSWVPTPARVVSSRVAAHSDSDGSTYRVDILYAYTFEGVERQSSRYDFSTGSSSGYAAKAAVVSHYPVGAATTCYVNPRRPAEAVLSREPFKALGFGAIGFVFLLVGLLGFASAGRLTNGGRPARVDGLPAKAAAVEGGGPIVLRPQQSRVAKFVFLLLFAIVWNGFVGFFCYLEATRASGGGWFVKAFIGLFGLVGLALIWAVFHQLLAIFNPIVRLTASGQSIALGSVLRLQWTVEGRASKLRRLRIVLEGREEATYRRGTDTTTDRHVFARLALLDSDDPARIAAGEEDFPIPATTMHTFEGRNNKVLWRLHVTGEIPRWPDIDDEYPVTILPQQVAAHPASGN
jgi:hypothetical protein